jgi:hypothetical protein
MIARVALELRRLEVDAHPSDGAHMKTSKFALGPCIPSYLLRVV